MVISFVIYHPNLKITAARLKISRIGIARGDGEAASKRRKTGRDARRNVAEEWYYRYGPKAHVGGQRNGC